MSYLNGKSYTRQQRANLCRERLAANQPQSNGWEYLYQHPDYCLPVWGQQDLKLMAHPTKPGRWVVQQGEKSFSYRGTVEQVTGLFFKTVEVKLIPQEAVL